MNLEQVLKLADELGITYELNSDNPGFFVVDADGTEKQVSIEEILLLDIPLK